MTDEFRTISASRLDVRSPYLPESSMKVQVEFDEMTYTFTGRADGEPVKHMSSRHIAVARALLQSALDELGDDDD